MYKQPEADIGVLYIPNDLIIFMGNLIANVKDTDWNSAIFVRFYLV